MILFLSFDINLGGDKGNVLILFPNLSLIIILMAYISIANTLQNFMLKMLKLAKSIKLKKMK